MGGGFTRRVPQTAPSNRIQSARQVAAILQQCVLHVQSPDNQLPANLSKRGRQTTVLIVVTAVIITGVALLIFAKLTEPPESTSDSAQTVVTDERTTDLAVSNQAASS